MAVKVLVILSTQSGAGKSIGPVVKKSLKQHSVDAHFRSVATPPQLRRLIGKIGQSYETIIVSGGDGTVVAALKELAGTDVKLLILPAGTGNLIAKSLGLSATVDQQLDSFCRQEYDVRYFDLAQTDLGLLALDIHIGWWATSTLDTSRSLKKKLGAIAYGLQALRSLPKQSLQTYRFRLDSGRVIRRQAYTAVFANKAVHNFFGLKLFNRPERQGTLEIAFIRSLSPLRFLVWSAGRLLTGRNIGGFMSTHYAYGVTILEAPTDVLYDDRPERLVSGLKIEAATTQTKLIIPSLTGQKAWQKWNKSMTQIRLLIVERMRNALSGIPTYRYSHVLPRLYLGGTIRQRAATKLKTWRVTTVINLRRAGDPAFVHDLNYLHLPTIDLQSPSITHLFKGVARIKRVIDSGEAVYVHCRYGEGRGPSLVAAYLISQHKMSIDDAIEHLTLVRPMAHFNASQRKGLELYYQKINRT